MSTYGMDRTNTTLEINAPLSEGAFTSGQEGARTSSPLRVLAVIPGSGEGSTMIFARRQVEVLRSENIDVRPFFLRSRTSPIAVLREFLRLRREIFEFRPALLHAHYGSMTSAICAAAGRLPVIVTFRGSDLNPELHAAPVRQGIAHAISQLSMLRARRAICVSEALRQKLWWGRQRVDVLPTGVDVDLFSPIPRSEARQRLGLDLTKPIVLFYVGNTPEHKGLPFIQSVVEIARKQLPELQLCLIRSDVAPAQMPLYYNAADCLVVASAFEGSPTVVQEALACNLPVVSVDVGDVATRLRGVTPSAIVSRNPEAFAAEVLTVLRSGIRSNGRAQLGSCDNRVIATEVKRIYYQVAARSAAN